MALLTLKGRPDFLFGSDFVSSVTTSVPEPTSIALIGAGLGLFRNCVSSPSSHSVLNRLS
ncbi:PEP-CTERM sorting domain-containing protein [Plasticicumulans sp.]|uniref:PEP-CTERM sorting domain-containing protein n=1 Tax=Plasticicumulans sp. TaxID=2307179 RepID=UPI00396474B8